MITIAIIVITCLTSYLAFRDRGLMNRMIMHPATVARNNEFYRFISSGFIHADWTHLGINMYVLYAFGQTVENQYTALFGKMGLPYFILMYFGAMFISSIPSYLKHRNHEGYRSLGASGATAGVVFAYILFYPDNWFLWPPLPAIAIGVGYLAYSFWASNRKRDNINHDAHAYGAIFGFLFTLALKPDLLPHFLGGFKRLIGG